METLSSHYFGSRDREGLLAFLDYCREKSKSTGTPRIASISLRVKDLDPLAVLQSIQEPTEPHLYLERRAVSVSGAESVAILNSTGPERFEAVREFVETWTSRIIATGDLDGWFSGPLFFQAFAFSAENVPSATVFLPKWQICRTEQECIAVANVRVEAETRIEPEAERILRAHGAFSNPASFGSTAAPGLGELSVRREDPDDYRGRVVRALEAIGEGRVEKVVLSRWMELIAQRDFRPLETLRGLREAYPDCFAFSYSRGEGASWIGATPERLMHLSGGRFETEALAGSAPRGGSLAADTACGHELLSSDKDLREHRYVVDAIVGALEGLGLRPEVAQNPHLLRLSNVQHLRTPISGSLTPDLSLGDLTARLHPTPAVGGVPREAAVDLIQEIEPFHRGLYTGFLGWEKPGGDGEAVVALRTARMQGKTARLFAGGGIVEGSDPDQELRETEFKLRAMANALGAKLEKGDPQQTV
ncbi:MAG: isochorismate synthase [Puniceicoccales bacterium]